ncbi:MAG: hypothetical protein ACFFAE_20595, partial [Candidatus Hodarchaeota archaeon]
MNYSKNSDRYIISVNPSKDEMKAIRIGLEDHNRKYPSCELNIPAPDISLVLKDANGNIVGGV